MKWQHAPGRDFVISARLMDVFPKLDGLRGVWAMDDPGRRVVSTFRAGETTAPAAPAPVLISRGHATRIAAARHDQGSSRSRLPLRRRGFTAPHPPQAVVRNEKEVFDGWSQVHG